MSMRRNVYAAAALALGLICTGCGAADDVPEFVITPASTSGESAESAESAENAQSAEPQPPPESAAQAEPAALLTSQDPRHFFLIEFGEASLSVSGVYDGSDVSAVYLDSNAECVAVPEYSGGSFSAVLDYAEVKEGLALLKIEGEALDEGFWVNVSGGRVVPADVSRLTAQTEQAVSAPRALPAEGALAYIDSERDPERMENALRQVREISDEVCAGLSGSYDKLHALARWVSANICYDYDAREDVTEQTLCLSHVLETHRTVCGGYANLLAALCAAQDIPCTLVRGEASPGSCFADEKTKGAYHEWLFAEIDGRRVWVDPVWNSPNWYADGKYHILYIAYERYFDVTPEVLSLDHVVHFAETRDYFGAGVSCE